MKDNCIRLLEQSDWIVSSSQFLYDVAGKHADKNKISIIRNGTEVEHFYQAAKLEKKKIIESKLVIMVRLHIGLRGKKYVIWQENFQSMILLLLDQLQNMRIN